MKLTHYRLPGPGLHVACAHKMTPTMQSTDDRSKVTCGKCKSTTFYTDWPDQYEELAAELKS